MSSKRILFIAHHRLDRSPGQRYRFEQVFDYLESKGLTDEDGLVTREVKQQSTLEDFF